MGAPDCKLVELPVMRAPEGNLTFIEETNQVPFEIARIYYLYDVPGDTIRGRHAHRALQQMLIAASGSFDVTLDDGFEERIVHLDRSSVGLMVTPMVWHELINFSPGAVCLALASAPYEESDYYRGYDEFIAAVRG